MTTFLKKNLTCSICGNSSTFDVLTSTNCFGSPDLDLRPAEMERSTINMKIQRCPKCGYCSKDISKSKEGAKHIMNTNRYKAIFEDENYPELARNYLCASIIDEDIGDVKVATWMAMNAAWACDDAETRGQASDCRLRALELLQVMENKGVGIGSKAATYILMADLMRRAGISQHLDEIIEKAIKSQPNEVELKVINYESELISRGDTGVHRIVEAIEFKKSPWANYP